MTEVGQLGFPKLEQILSLAGSGVRPSVLGPGYVTD